MTAGSQIKVCKFGGTSMADAAAIKNVENIIRADSSRSYIVVSAPGKRFKDDDKVTDLLYAAFEARGDGVKFGEIFGKIKLRFDGIINSLGIVYDLKNIYSEIEKEIKLSSTPDYAASRGEYLSALVLAKYLGFAFADTKDIIKFNSKKVFDMELTDTLAGNALRGKKYTVIPGFYGSDPDGRITTFSRGGSDITGSIISSAVGADIYENWTDVDGFLTADPRVVKNPELIDVLSYKELRELSYMGASVLHHEAIFPVKKAGIPINVKNTFDKEKIGTMIMRHVDLPKDGGRTITGIAGKKGYSVINIEKSLLNNEIGFVRKVLSVLEKYGISFEHMPTGIDTLSIVLSGGEFKIPPERLLKEISDEVNPDAISLTNGLSLIAIVGHGMLHKQGTAAKAFAALAEKGINIMMIDQGGSELNIIIAVDTKDYERAINAIYGAFFG
ncbi:MAG: aspartate kinase [Clostridiales bacterium]|nr:aspartate kinase [Clostridiales bacterium]